MTTTPRIALILDSARAFDAGLLRGIARYVDLHQPWEFIRPRTFYQRFSGLMELSAAEVRRHRPDGAIMNQLPLTRHLVAAGIPVIVVPVRPKSPGDCRVISNHDAAAVSAADHLIGLGLRNLAYAGFTQAAWSLERGRGFREQAARHGLACAKHLVALSPTRKQSRQQHSAIHRWLAQLPKPVGLLACNDEFALWLAELCRLKGLRIPDDIALVGIDNDELICQLCNPPLTSVPFATERAGYEAAERLDQLMHGRRGSAPDIDVAACPIVVRQSTDRLAIDDAEVVNALRFIRANAGRILQVRDVVQSTNLSQRTLHTRFRLAVGHSVGKEINHQRARHIARLLTATDEPLHAIARKLGYDTDAHLARYFRREMGETPRAYRQRR